MKKLILGLFATAVISMTAHAQTEKSTVLLGGNIGLQTSSGATVFSLNPNIGFFVVNNIAIGAELDLATTSGFTSWALGPYVKPYFGKSDAGKFFAKGSLLVGGATGTTTDVGFGIGAGYALFLNKSIALEFLAQYQKVGKSNDGVFGINIGFQIHLKK